MITFIDLFCGIGGFRLALEKNGATCVFSAEINEHACSMYKENFLDDSYCDITTLDAKNIPDFDVLCAGFPCQAFSRAGRQKGFLDTRGTLFFDICRIVKDKKPKVLLLENVKNLIIHDKGNTFKTIQENIKSLGYTLSWKILTAKDFNVPQNRERIILVAVRNDINKIFDFERLTLHPCLSLEPFLDKVSPSSYLNNDEYTLLSQSSIKQQKSGLIFVGYRNKNIRKTGVLENTLHLSRSHKQCNRIYSSTGTHPTLSSQESSGRYFIYHDNKVRKLTLNECFKIMGFPHDFKKVGSQSNLYARIGNSVCVSMIDAVFQQIKIQILE